MLCFHFLQSNSAMMQQSAVECLPRYLSADYTVN